MSQNAALNLPPAVKPIRLHNLLPWINTHPQNEQPLDETVQVRIQNIRTDLDAFSPAEVQLLIYQGYAAAVRAYDKEAAIPGFEFTTGHVPFPEREPKGKPEPVPGALAPAEPPPSPLPHAAAGCEPPGPALAPAEPPPSPLPQPDRKWLPYEFGDRRVDPVALHALRGSDRTRLGIIAWGAPLFYINFVLLVLLLILSYPAQLSWAWLDNLLFTHHVQPNPPSDAKYAFEEYHRQPPLPPFLDKLIGTCDAKDGNSDAYRTLWLRVGPFNSSGAQPIARFQFEAEMANGCKVTQADAFLVSKRQERDWYTEVEVNLKGNKACVEVPACDGDGSLLVLICVSRDDKSWPAEAVDIIQTHEVKEGSSCD